MSNGHTETNERERSFAENSSVETGAAVSAEAAVISELKRENERLRDVALRAAAETENTRRRGERDVRDARQYAVVAFAREMLAVSDNLQRAISVSDNVATQSGSESLGSGVRATERMLVTALSKFGARKIDAAGHLFDPNLHEAVMVTEDSDLPANTVVQVLEDGYTIHDRLLRPARVVIAAGNRIPRPGGGADDDRSL